MKNPPSFQFYPADYLADADVQAMSIEGEGCYIRLLCYCWRESSLPVDRVAIARLCKGYDGPGIDEALKRFKRMGSPDRFIHKRLKNEKIKQEIFHKRLQEAGLRGAEKRWGHGHSQAIAKTPMASDSSSSSSSSSPIKKENIIKKESLPQTRVGENADPRYKLGYEKHKEKP